MIGRIATALAVVLLGGCIERGAVTYRFSIPALPGQLADAKIVPGRYPGYEVLGLCAPIAWTQHRVVIRGQGARRLVRASETGWGDEMLALRARAEEALGSLALAVWYDESACHRGDPALTVYVGSYDQIPAAIERLGGLLRDEGLGDYAGVVVLPPGPRGQLAWESTWRMPLARRPFYPFELSLTAGPRYQNAWGMGMGAHIGLVLGREDEPPSKAGWFWGLGADWRMTLGEADRRWSVGPAARLGRAFGALQDDSPGSGANRGTYVYAGAAAGLSADSPVAVMSVGFTSLVVAEWVLTRYNRTGNEWYPLLLPGALLNHVEVAWELDTAGRRPSTVAVLLGFSL